MIVSLARDQNTLYFYSDLKDWQVELNDLEMFVKVNNFILRAELKKNKDYDVEDILRYTFIYEPLRTSKISNDLINVLNHMYRDHIQSSFVEI